MRIRNMGERGAVALITTMMFSVLISLLLVGMIGVMISEQRQQTDNEQAVTAYYAAESGVEDALHRLVGLHGTLPAGIGGTCLTVTTTVVPNAQVTCEYITASSNPTGKLTSPDKTEEVDSRNGYTSVLIQWDDQQVGNPGSYYQLPACALSGAAGCTPYTKEPPLEVAIAQYPTTSFASNNAVVQKLKNALIVPQVNGGPTPVIAYGSLSGNNPVTAGCKVTAPTYHCSMIINGLNPGSNYIFRLRSKFVGTSYSLKFYNGATPVNVPDGTYSIDVTAKSGDSTRRVLYKVPYSKGALSGLDFVIYSDNGFDKNFCSVGDGSHIGC